MTAGHRKAFIPLMFLLMALFERAGAGATAFADEVPQFSGDAHALGADMIVDRANQTPFTPTIEAGMATTAATLTSNGEKHALAAFFNPGPMVIVGPRALPLLCQAIQLPTLPAPIPLPALPSLDCPELPPQIGYPYLAEAGGANPGPVDASMVSAAGDPTGLLAGNTGVARAQVDPNGTSALGTTTLDRATLPGVGTSKVSTSDSSVRFEGDKLTASAVVDIQGLTILGMLSIGSLHSEATAFGERNGRHDGTGATTLGGVSLLGHKARIDSTGVHLDDTNVGAGQAHQIERGFDSLLGNLGMSLGIAEPKVEKAGREVHVTAGGLALRFQRVDPLGFPITVSVTFGAGSASVSNRSETVFSGALPTGPLLSVDAGGGPTVSADVGTAASTLPATRSLDQSLVTAATPDIRRKTATAQVLSPPLLTASRFNRWYFQAFYCLLASLGLALVTLAGWRAQTAALARRGAR